MSPIPDSVGNGVPIRSGSESPRVCVRCLLGEGRLVLGRGRDAPSLERDVASIPLPALIYTGERDEPERAGRGAALLPRATFVVLPGLDHAQAFRQSQAILPHVRTFLTRVAQEPAVATTE